MISIPQDIRHCTIAPTGATDMILLVYEHSLTHSLFQFNSLYPSVCFPPLPCLFPFPCVCLIPHAYFFDIL